MPKTRRSKVVFQQKDPDPKKIASPDLLTSSLFIALLAAFVFCKLPGLKPNVSDENIYFYMATAILRGSLPYRDFFYANPPGLLLILSLIAALGNSLLNQPESLFALFKSVPLLEAMVSGLALFLTLHGRWPRWPALFGTFAFLFSYDHLRASSHCTGIGGTLALVLIAQFFIYRRFALLGGVFLALACLIKTFGLVAVPPLFLLAWLRSGRKGLVECILAFGVVFMIINALCLGLFGGAFWKQTVLYHLNKTTRDGGNALIFLRVLQKNLPLTVLGLCGSVVLFRKKHDPGASILQRFHGHALEWASLLFLITLTLFMVNQSRVFDFYLVMGFPAAAILSTLAVQRGWSVVTEAFSRKEETRKPLIAFPRLIPVKALAGLWIALFAALLILPFPFAWQSHQQWGWVRGCLAYASHEASYFSKSGIIARHLQERAAPGDTILGDSGVVPLVAVLGRLRIAGDEADTNAMRFSSGTTRIHEFLGRYDKQPPRYVILRGSDSGKSFAGIGVIPEFRSWVARRYKLVTRWSDDKGAYYLYEWVSGPPTAPGS